MIKYQYALNENNEIIHVNDILDKGEEVFHCLSCNKVLIPKLGKIRQKHFSHKVKNNCSPETYLHKLGKRIFIDIYTNCLNNNLPFFIELPETQICTRFENSFGKICESDDDNVKCFDLTKYFKGIFEEKIDDNFKPDILLTGENNQKIYVEIAVTHKVTKEKDNLGIKIIEINIDNEDDLSGIISRKISCFDENVEIYNFKNIITKKSFCEKSKCDYVFETFILYNNGKSILKHISLSDLDRNIKSGVVQYYSFSENNIRQKNLFKYMVIKCYEEGYKIGNCFLCRYHADNKSYYNERPIFCKFLKESFNSNQASECNYYKPDPECFTDISF